MAAEDLAREVVVTVDGGSQLASSQSSVGLRRRWGSDNASYVNHEYNSQEDDDPWTLPSFRDDQNGIEDTTKWSDRPIKEKLQRVFTAVWKTLALLLLLYTFACTLDLLSSSFRLLGGRKAGQVFKDSELLKNPVVGLMIGVLATASLQSSSTSTSIVVTMVGTKLLTVRDAVPIVMGANIGTSVTNTLVSLGQSAERPVFRRAFAAATLHDMFNWLAVLCFLPIEVATGYLELLTGAIIQGSHLEDHRTDFELAANNETETISESVTMKPPNIQMHASLQTLTKPLTSLIIQLDKKLIEDLASGKVNDSGQSFMKKCHRNTSYASPNFCGYVFELLNLSDEISGCFLMITTMLLLVACLSLLVRLLRSVMKGHMAFVVSRLVNAEPPFPYSLVAGYAAMALGCAVTILVQSSSVFTSALTPLAGIGLVSLERIYPLTLGANLGTTTTSVLAAFAAPKESLPDTLRVALCHLFFNISGIVLFYPIPATRVPIPLAKLLGSTVVKYRWFAFVYLIGMFFVLPGGVFALSLLGTVVFASVAIPLLCLFLFVILVNLLQRKRPSLLPFTLRDWTFLPLWMRSLDPIDRLFSRLPCFRCCPGGYERRDGRALGDAIPHHSRMNILEPSSASGSALSLSSVAGIPSAESYQAVKGFEECAFATTIVHPRQCQNNNNYEKEEYAKHRISKTSDML